MSARSRSRSISRSSCARSWPSPKDSRPAAFFFPLRDRTIRAEMERTRTASNGNGSKRASTTHDGRTRPIATGSPRDRSDQVLTSREARQFLKIGRTKLHELTQKQIIPAYRIGVGRTSALRYLREDLLEWLVRQRV